MNFIEEVTLEELHDDPYPFYQGMREQAPIAYVPVLNEWLVTRWQDCAAIGRLSEDELIPNQANDREFFGMPNILCMEGEPHRKLRLGIDAQLNPRAVKQYLGGQARATIAKYINEVRDRGKIDLVADLFDKISVRVIGDKLGLSELDDETLVTWFQTLSGGLTNRNSDSDTSNAASSSIAEIDIQLREKIERLRAQPDDSVISHMLHGGLDAGEQPRTFEDVIGSIRVMILGGFQEPGNAVATAFLGLLSNPEQKLAAQHNPEDAAAAIIHESLRWVAPIGMVTRQARIDIEQNGTVIPQGSHLTLAVASANRDPEIFDSPQLFDFRRSRQPIATFGYGSHHCSGHFLAKALGQAVVASVLTELPSLELDPESRPVVAGMLFRGTKSLPVTL